MSPTVALLLGIPTALLAVGGLGYGLLRIILGTAELVTATRENTAELNGMTRSLAGLTADVTELKRWRDLQPVRHRGEYR